MGPPTPHGSTYSPWLHLLPMAPLTMAVLAMPRWGGSSTPCSTRRAPSAAVPRTRRTPRASRATPTSTSIGCCPASTQRSTWTRRALCRAAAHGQRPPRPPARLGHTTRQRQARLRAASGLGQPRPTGRSALPAGLTVLVFRAQALRAALRSSASTPALGAKTRQPSFCFSPAGPATDAARRAAGRVEGRT